MCRLFFLSLLLFCFSCTERLSTDAAIKNYEQQASRITIIRDTWGIPHVYGKTDADAVFGLMYVQCEEAFEKVERAYLEKLGRLAEIDGETVLYNDLLARLLYNSTAAKQDYSKAPAWLQKLCNAFADGVNYYMYKNPGAASVLSRFEPWYALLSTDGAYVSMKTESLTFEQIHRLYSFPSPVSFIENKKPEATGSNGFAIAPSKTLDKKALLYINPHVSFDFRMEAQVVSEEGLNAYGAVTWGQFFVYQGFNESCGWMHTSSMADAVDLYENRPLLKNDSLYFLYDGKLLPVQKRRANFWCKEDNGLKQYSLDCLYGPHGPVVGATANNKYLSLKANMRSLAGLVQSWQRMKATGFDVFKKTMALYGNPSTNTLYADNKGTIAYWHGNFIPKRAAAYDWSQPVDGSTSQTAWQGAHTLDEIVHVENPSQGFIQNCNSSPFNACGYNTIDRKGHPSYMAPDGENFRSALAIKELEKENGYTLHKLIALCYNHYLAAFDSLLPPLFAAYTATTDGSLQQQLKAPIALLQSWDKQSAVNSTATTLAIQWAYKLLSNDTSSSGSAETTDQVKWLSAVVRQTPPQKRLALLQAAVNGLQKTFGTWQMPWGDVMRYQRITNGQAYDANGPSLPVGMASALFGSLPAYEPVWTKSGRGYGYAGNSFVAAVEFGSRIKAKAVVPGGQSFHPASKHFSDQAELYLNGRLRDVFFYRDDVERNKEQVYKPGG